MKVALLQLNVTDTPEQNLPRTVAMVQEAAARGAEMVLTPEVTNCVSTNRAHQQQVLQHEAEDVTLEALRKTAQATGIWLSIGSLAVKTEDPDGRFANRSFLISPDGEIAARYDKIHMFDVQISESETYRESAGYRPGEKAVVAQTPSATLGLSICYDMRFPALYSALAGAGAQIIVVPSAFSTVTGAAHWHTLLRARAIETGCFVLAAAQTGTHASARNKTRDTYGHSLAIDPWGEVLLDAGTEPGVYTIDLDLSAIERTRGRVPSLANSRTFASP